MNAGKSKFLFFSLILLGMVLLAGCASQPTPSPTAKVVPPTVSSTPAVALTNTATATFTSQPTVDPDATSTPTPIKSSLGTDGWQVVDIPLVMETPAPIPTPSMGSAAYQLRSWSEEDALNLIRTAEEFSFADNIPFPPNASRYNYLYNQVTVKLAIQEALHRYPQTRFVKQLEWRIALANTILGQSGVNVDNVETDNWILQELITELSGGNFAEDDFNQALNPYGFGASLSDTIPNLMGRGQSGKILCIYWLDNKSTSLYAALGKDRQGQYQLVKIYSSWNFTHDFDQPYVIDDQTGDGIPEIMFSPYYYNGSWCGYELMIYQWQNGQFADLSQDQFHFNDCSPIPDTWEYGVRDARGAKSLITRKAIGYYSHVIRVNTYKWNGDWYVLSEIYVEPPDQINHDTAEWLIYSMGEQDYSTLTKNIPTYLSTPSKLSTVKLGRSYRDYMIFQLGIAHMQQGNEREALKHIKEVAVNPHDASITTVSQAAQAYLDNYSGKDDIYRACQAALTVMETAAGEHLYGTASEDISFIKKNWNYYVDSYSGHGTLCNLRGAFNKLIAGLDKTHFAQAPEILQRQGVLIRFANSIDIDGDGEKEWVLLVNTPGDDAPIDMWVLVNIPEKIVALPVVTWQRRQYDLPDANVESLVWDCKTILSPNSETISLIKFGDFLYLFQINVEKNALEWLIDTRNAKNYTIRRPDNTLEIETSDGTSNTLFVWSNEKSQLLYNFQERGDTPLANAEEMLLIRGEPGKALPLLENLLSNLDTQNLYLAYLLGLAYEWQGDEVNAVKVYWDIWKNFPESAYACLAQAKLEERK